MFRGSEFRNERRSVRCLSVSLLMHSTCFIAKLKGYIDQSVYSSYRSRYKECIRMLNGLEKSLEKHLPESERRWSPEL